MSKIITIYIDDATLKLVDDTAEVEDRSRSNLIRKALKEYIKNKE